MTTAVKATSAANPFTSGTTRRRTLILTGALIGVALLLVALFVGRAREKAAQTTADHVHGATQAALPTTPVMISAQAAQRIGVTFAPVTLGPVTREIRTVAQVTFDETRLKIIS